MLSLLCENDDAKIAEGEQATLDAIGARMTFWDNVLEAIEKNRRN